jgi:GNAT superfamily N-acetyltransferase
MVELYVLPEARKHGHGTALLTAMLDELEAAGRTHVRTAIVEGTPGDDWFAARGGTVGLPNRKSRLDVGRLDRSMVRTWVADGERLAGDAGYSLHFLDRTSDADVAGYAAARAVMNTATKG